LAGCLDAFNDGLHRPVISSARPAVAAARLGNRSALSSGKTS
jgi:hypothetical protein